jgi:hypothetical protein
MTIMRGARLVAAAVFAAVSAQSATAATMTFGGLPSQGEAYGLPDQGATYVEDGITATGTAYYRFANLGLPLFDFGTPWSNSVAFSTGGLFDPVSLTFSGSATVPPKAKKRNNLFITGFLNGSVVAEKAFALRGAVGPRTLALGAAFAGIDRLEVVVRYAYGFGPGYSGCAPCTSVTLSRVELAPIPLPAAGLAMLGALAGLGAAAARRRVRTPE